MADAPHAPDSPLLSREGQEANPHRLAGLFLKERLTFSEGIGLRFWRDVFYFWDGSAYREVPTGELRAQFSQSLACEFDRLYNHEQVRWARERDETPSPAGARRLPRPIAVTSRMMADVLQAIAGLVLIPAADCPDQSAWVQGFPDTSVPAAASLGAGACQASGAGTNGLQDPLSDRLVACGRDPTDWRQLNFPDPTGLQVLKKCRVSGRRHFCHPTSFQGRGCENGRSTEDPASGS